MPVALDQLVASQPTGDALALVNALNSLNTQQALNDAVDSLAPAVDGSHVRAGLIAAKTGATGVLADRLTKPDRSLEAEGYRLWIEPFGARTEQDARGGRAGYDVGTIGTAIGIETSPVDHGRLGIALSYADSSVSGEGSRDHRVDMRTAQASAYGTIPLDRHTHLGFLGAVGQSWNDGQRRIRIDTLDRRVESDYRSWHVTAGAEVAKRYILPGVIEVMPSASAIYSYARAESFDETGAGLVNLNVEAAGVDSLDLGIKTTVTYHVRSNVVVSANTGLVYDLLASADRTTATLAGGDASFATKGIKPNPFGVVGGLKLELLPKSGVSISASYSAEARASRIRHQGQLQLSLPF